VRLADNKQLYEYLLFLSAELKSRGSNEMSELLTDASHHVAGMSTEFLGESRIALRRVSREAGSRLTEREHSDLVDVLTQLNAALDQRVKSGNN
jgi:hypothetical protein